MNDTETLFVQGINKAIRECESLLFITRCSDLQRKAIDAIHQKFQELSEAKMQAIEEDNEDYANILLGLQCVVKALISELSMYIALRGEDPDAAWDYLIDAQNALAAAARTHKGFEHCRIRWKKLRTIEKVVFPSQVFLSVGTVVDQLKCSICGEDYDQCQHLVGLPYMGEMCNTIIANAELDHIAIVDRPADKRCRIKTFGSKGVQRNRMTLREEGRAEDTGTENASGVVFRNSSGLEVVDS